MLFLVIICPLFFFFFFLHLPATELYQNITKHYELKTEWLGSNPQTAPFHVDSDFFLFSLFLFFLFFSFLEHCNMSSRVHSTDIYIYGGKKWLQSTWISSVTIMQNWKVASWCSIRGCQKHFCDIKKKRRKKSAQYDKELMKHVLVMVSKKVTV